MTAIAPTSTPGSLRGDISVQVERLFAPPRNELTSLAINAALVTALWTLLPATAKDWLFTLTGPMAFAVVLQAWVLGDTSTTNVLGNDVDPALAVLHDKALIRRWLRAKAAALGLVVGIPCAVVAIAIAATQHAYLAGLLLALVLVTAPLGSAALAGWLGMTWPYHPRPLRWRWARRRARRRIARWLALVVAPFVLVPLIMAVFLTVGAAVGAEVGGREANGHLDLTGFAVASVVTTALSLTAFACAPFLSGMLGNHRMQQLTRILLDADAG